MRTAKILGMMIVAGLIAFAAAGCGQSAETVNAATKTPAPTSALKGTETTPRQVNTIAGITQEDAGIKIRVDMPEIKEFLAQSKQGPIIPALKQNFIPQGMAYLEQKKWILISHYREDGKSNLLSVVDAENGQLVKALELYTSESEPYTGHAGGVTISNKYIWISSESKVYYFLKDDLIKADRAGKIVFKGFIQTPNRASFNAFADGVLWVGEFAQGASYPTDKSHYITNRDGKEHKAWAVGYKLDASTDLPDAMKSQPTGPVVPDMIISLPDSVQAMYMNKDSIWLSQSYGRNSTSELTRYKLSLSEMPHTKVKLESSEIPVWFLDNKNKGKKLQIAPMSEGIFELNEQIYILFESGATKYKTSSSYALDRIHSLPWRE